MDYEIDTDPGGPCVRFSLDRSVYPDAVVFKAAYWLTDRFYLFFDPLPVNRLQVELRPKPSELSTPLAQAAGEFHNALLDFRVRQFVLEETRPIREALVTKAFMEGRPSPGLGPCLSDETAFEHKGDG